MGEAGWEMCVCGGAVRPGQRYRRDLVEDDKEPLPSLHWRVWVESVIGTL